MKKLKDLKISADSVGSLCTITPGNRKLQALARATPYMNLQKRKVLLNAFSNTQFNYCPLIWMLHNRQNNNKIKHLFKRCLRLIHNDQLPCYEQLLQKKMGQSQFIIKS